MAKYEPLTQFLKASEADELRLAFHELERALGGPLPPSAHRFRAWWANERTKSQSRAWLGAGWHVWKVDLEARTVLFRRLRGEPARGAGRPLATERAPVIALDGLNGAALRMIDDYAEGHGVGRAEAAVAILNAAGIERRMAVLRQFQSRTPRIVGSDSVDLIRDDRDAR